MTTVERHPAYGIQELSPEAQARRDYAIIMDEPDLEIRMMFFASHAYEIAKRVTNLTSATLHRPVSWTSAETAIVVLEMTPMLSTVHVNVRTSERA